MKYSVVVVLLLVIICISSLTCVQGDCARNCVEQFKYPKLNVSECWKLYDIMQQVIHNNQSLGYKITHVDKDKHSLTSQWTDLASPEKDTWVVWSTVAYKSDCGIIMQSQTRDKCSYPRESEIANAKLIEAIKSVCQCQHSAPHIYTGCHDS
eukprot:TRINITY_DN17528_c0_g1_i1.p1 TRINITY_DN17528_c0_g1~~TRINITY_DN17528_c0_g1_i1.p1  ORF type:complete len:152 (-),score=23.62 TRINITY_DN17528_c0_g1_i1:83-538(-)